MKLLFITIYTFIFLISSAKSEECIYTYETTPEKVNILNSIVLIQTERVIQ